MMPPESVLALTSLAALFSLLGAAATFRNVARARALANTPRPADPIPLMHDASLRVRYLRSLTAIGTALEAMRANFERGSAIFGNIEPPVTELAELCAAAAPLGRSLDVGILHATMYWLRERCYQRAFTAPSPEVCECRARIDAALWETRRLMGLTQETPFPRTLAEVEMLAELATPSAAPASLPGERGRRVAARRDARIATAVSTAASATATAAVPALPSPVVTGKSVRTATVH